jgi:transposase
LRNTKKNCVGPFITKGVKCWLLRDKARPHTAACTRALLEHFNWELFDHPPYSPDLAPSDYHLFTYRRTGWNYSASTIMRSSWKLSKRGWSHRQQTSLTQAYKYLLPDATSASIFRRDLIEK